MKLKAIHEKSGIKMQNVSLKLSKANVMSIAEVGKLTDV